ncbi:MAG: hypothetical protein V4696_03900 [Pseudomonadota bacterium]
MNRPRLFNGRIVHGQTLDYIASLSDADLAKFRARHVGTYAGLVAAADEEKAKRGASQPSLEFAPQYERPLAAAPFTSYRYAGPYGGIAIGARDTADALKQAARSLSSGEEPDVARLQKWNGEAWESAL